MMFTQRSFIHRSRSELNGEINRAFCLLHPAGYPQSSERSGRKKKLNGGSHSGRLSFITFGHVSEAWEYLLRKDLGLRCKEPEWLGLLAFTIHVGAPASSLNPSFG